MLQGLDKIRNIGDGIRYINDRFVFDELVKDIARMGHIVQRDTDPDNQNIASLATRDSIRFRIDLCPAIK